MGRVGFEPTRGDKPRGILSPLRLPVPPPAQTIFVIVVIWKTAINPTTEGHNTTL